MKSSDVVTNRLGFGAKSHNNDMKWFDSIEEERGYHHGVGVGMIYMSVLTFAALHFIIDPPWGKTSNSLKFLGPRINPRLAWFVFESPNLLWSCYCFVNRDPKVFGPANMILLMMFAGHYINRAIIYPLTLNPNSKPLPMLSVSLGCLFCAFNGYLQARGHCQLHTYDPDYCMSFQLVAGVCVFFLGICINQRSDSILRNLRKPGESGYKIPRGFLFEYVSAPHYFGEIVEWIGYAIAMNRLGGWAFAIYSASNLIPIALSNNIWYKTKFEDYPPNRRAVIPFLW